MKRTRTAFEYLGNVAKLVFSGKRNKQGSVEFDGDSVNLKVNNVDSLVSSESGVSIPGTLAVTGATSITGALVLDGGVSLQSGVVEKTASVTLTATEIVGTAAGDIGHVDGAILVASPGSGYVLEFVSALLIYDYDTAAYTGGADDCVIQIGGVGSQVTLSGAITGANLLEGAGDKVLQIGSIATELLPMVNSAISIAGTALTQPGTAAGVLRCKVTYRIHTTEL